MSYRDFVSANLSKCVGDTPQERMKACGAMWREHKTARDKPAPPPAPKPAPKAQKPKGKAKERKTEPPMEIKRGAAKQALVNAYETTWQDPAEAETEPPQPNAPPPAPKAPRQKRQRSD